ncbi:MAG TPA: penicillin-binding transpeptidase domain-containing protein [Anaerolineales bacterium]|nr:penicillin-binding transpeptidase domain-containing protein [Anaerolineales bacterium]
MNARPRLSLTLLALTMAACGRSEATGELPTPAVTSVAAPDSEQAAAEFLDAWKAQDYRAMYDMLSPLTQDAVSLDDFETRYADVRRSAAVSGIDYEIVSSLVNPQAAQVRYRLNLHSAVFGDIVRETYMDLTRAEDDWRVAWSDSAILPELAGGNTLLADYVTPTRANIYDRAGLGLATQTDAVALWIDTGILGDEDAQDTMLRVLARLLDRHPDSIRADYENYPPGAYYIPLGEVSIEDFRPVQDTLAETGGVRWTEYTTRYYPSGGLAPQSVGYVSQVRQEDLAEYQALGYRGDEFVGQVGLEAVYEDELRGKPGGTLYVMDPGGQPVGTIVTVDPQLPQAIYTTLDRDLQRQAQQAIAEFRGAIVVLERDSGRVLALVSSPGFDPNLFDTRNPNWQYGLSGILEDQRNPLVNRATVSSFPLGSVFKMITMAAALESGLYTPESIYNCTAEFTEVAGGPYYDWTVEAELPPSGELTLPEGLMRSCNPYFWHIGVDLFNRGHPTALPDMAKAFGLGKPTGIEINESGGLVPDPDWKQQSTGEDWSSSDSMQLAIGQSALNVTPLQVARFIAALGNGGTLYQPQMVERIQNAEGVVSHQFEPVAQGTLPLSEATLAVVQEAMGMVVNSPRGTAYRRFLNFPITLYGKTGTAESGIEDPHAWFGGYTDEGREDKPDIAVVVLAENQGQGSEWAAPIFRRVLEAYFFGQPYMTYPWESQIGVTKTETPTPGPDEEATDTPTP